MWAAPTAHFELRLAPTESDGVLTLGDANDQTLDLEVWVEISDSTAGPWAVAFYLKTSQNGVIQFDENYVSIPLSNLVYAGAPNNTPFTGDFSPAGFEVGGTMAGVGAPALYGTFSVSALAEGAVSYIFDDAPAQMRPWKVSLTDGGEISGSDLSFSIDPAVATIQVVASAPSADADGDGDVDLHDYRALQACATSNGAAIADGCTDLDLTLDGAINDADVTAFLFKLTGVNPIPGDLNADRAIDLRDFARFGICFLKSEHMALIGQCGRADVDRDGDIDLEDYDAFAAELVGPAPP